MDILTLQHANIISYLSTKLEIEPPRMKREMLQSFLNAFRNIDNLRKIILNTNSERISKLLGTLSDEAHRLLQTSAAEESEEFLEGSVIQRVLRELKSLFGSFSMIGLRVAASVNAEQAEDLDQLLRAFADNFREDMVFIVPEINEDADNINFFDPSEELAITSMSAGEWPGILLWSSYPRGMHRYSIFIPNRYCGEFLEEIILSEPDPQDLHEFFEKMRGPGIAAESPPYPRSIIHISDLHFGTEESIEKSSYLLNHLRYILKKGFNKAKASRVVITGDLFNNPRRVEAQMFRNFRIELRHLTNQEPIVIPGNHDQKWLGNFGSELAELANLEWSNLVVDDSTSTVYFCFDSSREANLARGKVSERQRLDVATLFEAERSARPYIDDYMRVALVHHHPFSFNTKRETRIQRILHKLGLNDETFMRMDDADQFILWCARKNIPLILHGHKHVQRYVKENIMYARGSEGIPLYKKISAVGCGTSLGAEGYPLSYNVISWNPRINSWTTSFFADPGDGSGFAPQFVQVNSMGHGQ